MFCWLDTATNSTVASSILQKREEILLRLKFHKTVSGIRVLSLFTLKLSLQIKAVAVATGLLNPLNAEENRTCHLLALLGAHHIFHFIVLRVKCVHYRHLVEGILLTYLLTPWCRVLLEKLTGLQLVKKLPAFHGTRRFITALTSVRHLPLSWASPIQSIYTHPTSWGSILMLSTHLRLGLPSGLLPSGFPTKTLYTPLSYPICATCPAHSWRNIRF